MADKNLDVLKVQILGCDYAFCYVHGSAMQQSNIEGIGEWWKCPECGALDKLISSVS